MPLPVYANLEALRPGAAGPKTTPPSLTSPAFSFLPLLCLLLIDPLSFLFWYELHVIA